MSYNVEKTVIWQDIPVPTTYITKHIFFSVFSANNPFPTNLLPSEIINNDLEMCSGNGMYLEATSSCFCHPNYSGENCNCKQLPTLGIQRKL